VNDLNADDFQALLNDLGACREARRWARGRTLREAWDACERGDWLLRLAGTTGVNRRKLVLVACGFARNVRKHVPAGEHRHLKAIEAGEAWARGGGPPSEAEAEAAEVAAYAAEAAHAAEAAYVAESAATGEESRRESARIVRGFITADDVLDAVGALK
jgi:hypothetical protein